MANPRIGYQVKLFRQDDADPNTKYYCPGVTRIDPPYPDLADLDATSSDSPNATMEFVGGLIDPGTVTADFQWDPADDFVKRFRSDIVTKTNAKSNKPTWGIEYPDGASATFTGLAKQCKPLTEIKGVMMASLVIKVSGPITFVDPVGDP